MYFAWRRNMRDQELHRWMHEKIQWSREAAEYWKQEYTRQQEQWYKQQDGGVDDGGNGGDELDDISSQNTIKKEILSAVVQEGLTEGKQRKQRSLQRRRDDMRGESSSAGFSGFVEEEISSYVDKAYTEENKENRELEESNETRIGLEKTGIIHQQQQTSKSPSLRNVDEEIPTAETDTISQSDGNFRRRGKRKNSVRNDKGRKEIQAEGEKWLETEHETEETKDENNKEGENQCVTTTQLRDLASQVMSSLSDEEIRDIAVNGYRLPPMTAAIASSPIPWWASCKGEHKWRGKNVATNVQSRWVNWANPHRVIEAAIGRYLLPREGGVLDKLRKKGEELKQVLQRVERGEEKITAASTYKKHPKNRGKRDMLARHENSLDCLGAEEQQEQQLNENLREIWKHRKSKGGREGGRGELKTEEGDDELFVSSESAKESDIKAKVVFDHQDERLGKTKDCEETTSQVEEKKEKGGRVFPSSRAEKAGALPTQSADIKSSQRGSESLPQSLTTEREDMCSAERRETNVQRVVDEEGKREGGEISEKGMRGRSDGVSDTSTCSARSGSELHHSSLSSGGSGVKCFLWDKEKQRKAIEAAIDVSLMLGHSTIVKTQGAAVPYDVHCPFMRSRTSSRRRRMRLRGRERDHPERRNMTRQERRLANRDERLKQEQKRKDDAKAARRRAWQESQRY